MRNEQACNQRSLTLSIYRRDVAAAYLSEYVSWVAEEVKRNDNVFTVWYGYHSNYNGDDNGNGYCFAVIYIYNPP